MWTNRLSHKGCRGFSLVEVLVAFAILASVLTATLGVFSASVSSTRQVAGYERAVGVAVARMSEISRNADLEPGLWNGETEEGLRWITTVGVLPTTGEEKAIHSAIVPYNVKVTVAWQENAKERSVEIHSIRLGKGL